MQTLQLTDRHSGARAAILPEAGFNLFDLQLPVHGRDVHVLDAEPEFAATGANSTHSGIPLLFPYPNRIRGGRYMWNGRDYTLSGVHQDGKGNAIHGLVFDRPWRVVGRGDDFVVGQFQLSIDAPDRVDMWPADFIFEVRYALADGLLRCDLRIANPDQAPLPWGFGTHPYFRVPLEPGRDPGQCLIQARAGEEWELIECLPTGQRRPVSGGTDLCDGEELRNLKLDDALTGLSSTAGAVQSIVMDPAAGVQVVQTADAAFRELVVYTPGHGRSVCLEPYTCMTDAINLTSRGIDSGLRVLPAGGEYRTWFQIAASPIYA